MLPLPGSSEPQRVTAHEPTDVLVIGAGAAGLTAARKLTEAGLSVRVLESADRVGGRTHTQTTSLGSIVDLGGQWVGHDHVLLTGLMRELGLEYYPMYNAPAGFTLANGELCDADSAWIGDAYAALENLEQTARAGMPDVWATQLVSEWIEAEVHDPRAQQLVSLFCSLNTTSEAHLLTVKFWLGQILNGGGFEAMEATTNGPQENLLFAGLGAVAERMAAELGDAVLLSCRVTEVQRSESGFTVHAERGTFAAKRVVVTVPVSVLHTIQFNGLLPDALQHYVEHSYMGVVYKAMAVYERPFWRERGDVSGVAVGEIAAAFQDTSPPGGPGHITVLIGGEKARSVAKLSAADRQRKILSLLMPAAGSEILTPVDWFEKAWWEDEHVGGGYHSQPFSTAANYQPPQVCDLGNGLFVAGTEYAGKHFGYVEGAVETGCDAAQAVIAASQMSAHGRAHGLAQRSAQLSAAQRV